MRPSPGKGTSKVGTGYGEMAGYDPVELGFLVWKIRDGIITGCERVTI
jgi:hypothetical protein